VPIVLKSVSLNLLEISGPVQACNGIVFTFIYLRTSYSKTKRLISSLLVIPTFEDESNTFFPNTCRQLSNEAASQPRRTETPSLNLKQLSRQTLFLFQTIFLCSIFSFHHFSFSLPEHNPHSPHRVVL
jgi:hypothetical protein